MPMSSSNRLYSSPAYHWKQWNAGGAHGRVPLQHRVQAAARAAVAVDHDHALIARQQILQLRLHGRRDLQRDHVQVR